MPAGNDASVALAELADKVGEGVGKASDLIVASRARYKGDLGAANLLDIDKEATEEISRATVKKAAGKGTLVDYAVRGDYLVWAVEDEDGRLHKGAASLDSLRGKSKSSDAGDGDGGK